MDSPGLFLCQPTSKRPAESPSRRVHPLASKSVRDTTATQSDLAPSARRSQFALLVDEHSGCEHPEYGGNGTASGSLELGRDSRWVWREWVSLAECKLSQHPSV